MADDKELVDCPRCRAGIFKHGWCLLCTDDPGPAREQGRAIGRVPPEVAVLYILHGGLPQYSDGPDVRGPFMRAVEALNAANAARKAGGMCETTWNSE